MTSNPHILHDVLGRDHGAVEGHGRPESARRRSRSKVEVSKLPAASTFTCSRRPELVHPAGASEAHYEHLGVHATMIGP